MIALPETPTDSLQLADWLELCALVAPDGDASKEQLDSAVRTAAVFPVEDEDEEIEALCLDVFRELEARERAAAEGYPFKIEHPMLRRSRDWQKRPVYIFCLCLSYFGVASRKQTKAYPRRWFESIAREAAARYMGGDAVRLAWPRVKDEIPIQFGKAVEKLCRELLLEGEGFSNKGLPYPKDGGVDVVAWKHFPDRLVGKLVLFGNCATEKNWTGAKKTELMPHAFCEEWMSSIPPSAIVRSLFVPHRCEERAFASHTRRAGIIFDRCRIAYWFQQGLKTADRAVWRCGLDQHEVVSWTEKTIQAAVL